MNIHTLAQFFIPSRPESCRSWLIGIGLSMISSLSAAAVPDIQVPTPPLPPHSVYGTTPPVTVLLYSLDPNLLAGWNFPVNKAAGLGMSTNSHYLLPGTRHLPVLGGWDPGDKPQMERVLTNSPKLALLWAPYRDTEQMRNALHKIGIPTLTIPLQHLSDYPQAYKQLGVALGVPDRGERLARSFQHILDRLQQLRARIPPSQRQTVYYAEGVDGLMSDPETSPHTAVIRAAGGVNVFTAEPTALKGMERIAMGQVLEWNPDVILVQDPVFFRRIHKLPAWQGLKAVQMNRVYLIPNQPFNWMDRPPSFMQAMGALWLAHLLYPTQSGIDLPEETRQFFKTFLQVDITPEEAQRITASGSAVH
jgi:iron complex transport system substrate-binding protein